MLERNTLALNSTLSIQPIYQFGDQFALDKECKKC